MPSVRIKRHNYSTLSDRDRPTSSPDEPRSLSHIFRRPPSDPTAAAAGLSTSPEPVSPTSLDSPPAINVQGPSTMRRARAGSRVQDHCLSFNNQSMRLSAAPVLRSEPSASSFANSRRTASPTRFNPVDGVVTLEGPTADIQVHSHDGEPGLVGSALSLRSEEGAASYQSYAPLDDHHHDDIVEHLDVIDPQVATISNLTNAANSIVIPPLSWYSRKPVVVLSDAPDDPQDREKGERVYEDSLDRHVNDVLKRPSKVRRTLRGVWSFLKTPMGIITGIYGFLVVFWGAAIVIFLVKIINFHNANTQGFWVEVSSQVVNGLFTVTGIGLIPSRVLDTYRVYKIWHYKRKSRRLRAKAGLPPLFDEDDLPDPAYDPNYVHVLSEEEQNDLHRQQRKFQHHQTWYRPHGTATHRAFPINTALWICLFNDGNSIFQIILCGTMWGLNRFQRPAWSTGILIPASFLCGIASAVYIARGSSKTKRIKEVEKRLRDALAMEHPEELSSLKGGIRGNRSEAALSTVGETEKTVQTPDVVVDEHMTISAAAAAAEKRKMSSERRRPSS